MTSLVTIVISIIGGMLITSLNFFPEYNEMIMNTGIAIGTLSFITMLSPLAVQS